MVAIVVIIGIVIIWILIHNSNKEAYRKEVSNIVAQQELQLIKKNAILNYKRDAVAAIVSEALSIKEQYKTQPHLINSKMEDYILSGWEEAHTPMVTKTLCQTYHISHTESVKIADEIYEASRLYLKSLTGSKVNYYDYTAPQDTRLLADIKRYSDHYYKLGLNVTCVSNRVNEFNKYAKNTMKVPNHNWKHLGDVRQTLQEAKTYKWDIATGAGTVAGFQNLTAIDIDNCNDISLVHQILNSLGLETKYEWLVRTGSGNGFHIIIKAEKFKFLEANQVVITYSLNKDYQNKIQKIEILWNTHIMLPPSLHPTNGHYKFENCIVPIGQPVFVSKMKIDHMIKTYLQSETKMIGEGYDKDYVLLPI